MTQAAAIINAYGRDYQSLNGRWSVLVDQYDQGTGKKVFEDKTASADDKTTFYEYSFDNALRLDVPGDWNSQNPELKYYEGTVWYGRHFDADPKPGDCQILYFAGVSYRCNVYLNGRLLGSHEGSFTPFEFDVTDILHKGDNFLCVEVNNRRSVDAIPAMAFDWWNYGGITRDVMLISLPDNYIKDYNVQLDKHMADKIDVNVAMARPVAGVKVSVDIPGLNRRFEGTTDAEGKVSGSIKAKGLKRWAPDAPALYDVIIAAGDDQVSEKIGFRNIEVDGTRILVNGVPTFMRAISFHEEIPQRLGRACSKADAAMLLSEAKDLGVNMIRLAHYPQNEHTVRMAEEMGILLWQEIPVWQGIDFANPQTREKAQKMLTEMINRDKNRCAVGFWGVANETKPSPERDAFLKSLLETGRAIDSTRLYVAAFDLLEFDPERGLFAMNDPFTENLDVVAVNKYLGWYHPWPLAPADATWEVNPDKPLIISEFGCEAMYGKSGSDQVPSSWSEEYQERLYRDNITMFENIPNLAGVSPWLLFDFRSPFRMHPTNQEGWNRKGLVSDRGERKRAWHVMHDYYENKRLQQPSATK